MDNKGISALKIAGAYIGTVVGAGFASGQEILQFFAVFGALGLWGIVISTLMFIVFGYIIMSIGNKISATSHLDILRYSGGGYFILVMDILISLFIFCSLTAMIAGSGALFSQQLGLPKMLGCLFMVVLTVLTVLCGFGGVVNSISALVPFLLTAVIGVSLFALTNKPPNFVPIATQTASPFIGGWLPASILYASYNLIMSVAVLASLGASARDKRAIKNGAMLGGLGLGAAAIMICLTLQTNIGSIENLELPFMHIAAGLAPAARIVYAVVLISEVYTTAVSALYGCYARISGFTRSPTQKLPVLIVSALAFAASTFSFSNIVKYLYPLIGYCGVFLLLSLLYAKLFGKKKPMPNHKSTAY